MHGGGYVTASMYTHRKVYGQVALARPQQRGDGERAARRVTGQGDMAGLDALVEQPPVGGDGIIDRCRVHMLRGAVVAAWRAQLVNPPIQDRKFDGAASRQDHDAAARLAALANCNKGTAGECIVRITDCNK